MSAPTLLPQGGSRGTAGPEPVLSRSPLLPLATLGLVVAACLPLTRAYIGLDIMRPVLAAALLSFGVSWGCRRLGAGPVPTLFASALAWLTFCSLAFFDDTLWGVLPTRATLAELRDLWVLGLQLIRVRPSPAFAEAGLVLVTVTGVWAVVHSVEGLVFRIGAPVKAIGMALVLWLVPLAVSPSAGSAWPLAVPFLAASASLLLAFAGADLVAWAGAGPRAGRAGDGSLGPTGAVVAGAAIVAGVLLAGVLPGFGEPPWYPVRGIGGSRLTSNPIVEIRNRLVDQSPAPVLRLRSPQPVYLRVTGLDVYSAQEEWTLDGVDATPVDGRIPVRVSDEATLLTADVTVADLPADTVLVPAPYQPVSVEGPLAEHLQYDASTATLTLDRDGQILPGDRYQVQAAIPAASPEALRASGEFRGTRDPLVRLPPTVPDSVRDLAREIVDAAGAVTVFDMALAIQEELRTWEYSLAPQSGHSGGAMASFITNRVGYCEQFAGTMAVMLRTLGIPARVAVGYTPGELVADEYVVTGANAHAWVEVLFPRMGWIAFEPTPRADGNVLVPTSSEVAPVQTAAQAAAAAPEPAPALPAPDDLFNPTQDRAPIDDVPAPAFGSALPTEQRPPAWLLVLLGAALGLVALGALLRSRRRAAHATLPPRDRVLAARRRIGTLGRGMGVRARPSETDREYLERLIALDPVPRALRPAAAGLAAATDLARWSARLPEGAVAAAEDSAAALRAQLLSGLPRWQRALIGARGPLSTAADAARLRLSTAARRSDRPRVSAALGGAQRSSRWRSSR